MNHTILLLRGFTLSFHFMRFYCVSMYVIQSRPFSVRFRMKAKVVLSEKQVFLLVFLKVFIFRYLYVSMQLQEIIQRDTVYPSLSFLQW